MNMPLLPPADFAAFLLVDFVIPPLLSVFELPPSPPPPPPLPSVVGSSNASNDDVPLRLVRWDLDGVDGPLVAAPLPPPPVDPSREDLTTVR
jgi:hypothetical protein